MDYIIAIPLTIITVAIIMWPITLGIIIKIFGVIKKVIRSIIPIIRNLINLLNYKTIKGFYLIPPYR